MNRLWIMAEKRPSRRLRDVMGTELYEAGVDHINTDDFPALQAFLSSGSS